MWASKMIVAGLVLPSLFACSHSKAKVSHETYFGPRECGWISQDYFSNVFGKHVPKLTPQHNPIGKPPEVPSTYGCYAALPSPDGADTTVLSGIICPADCARVFQGTRAREQEAREIKGLGTQAFWYPFTNDAVALDMLTDRGAEVSLVLTPVPGTVLRIDKVTALKAFAARAETALAG